MYIVSFNFCVRYSSMKIIFIIIFTNIGCITQMLIVIGITIDNIISNTKRYKLIILYIEQAIIDLHVLIQKIVDYQLIQGVYNILFSYCHKFVQIFSL